MSGQLILRWRDRHDVRMVARRPRDAVLVEFMSSRGVPMLQYAVAQPHELKALRISMEHLKQLIAVLPMVAFATDSQATPETSSPTSADAFQYARLPYVD